ncbi:uncharacterized protein TRIREDRAFT_109120 [Trichoderma reesei QM6a]|uniref:Predicted protein n=1 Tax=Hypocrea jecorina (strain QM6a) TaxID=431241 RepID=G0RN83_HYPJQ|nr:uncharacterized protein TRIREDRAFT_109120 [Trichoderma reesei QM6a]EGR47226.1 predicted protein [Trichoderma reesei QM6a]
MHFFKKLEVVLKFKLVRRVNKFFFYYKLLYIFSIASIGLGKQNINFTKILSKNITIILKLSITS